MADAVHTKNPSLLQCDFEIKHLLQCCRWRNGLSPRAFFAEPRAAVHPSVDSQSSVVGYFFSPVSLLQSIHFFRKLSFRHGYSAPNEYGRATQGRVIAE